MADSEKPFLTKGRSFRNWSNEVQYRRVDFTNPNIKGQFIVGTLAAGTYIVHKSLDGGITLVNDLPEGNYLQNDVDIVVNVTGGTPAAPQRMIVAFVPLFVENMGQR